MRKERRQHTVYSCVLSCAWLGNSNKRYSTLQQLPHPHFLRSPAARVLYMKTFFKKVLFTKQDAKEKSQPQYERQKEKMIRDYEPTLSLLNHAAPFCQLLIILFVKQFGTSKLYSFSKARARFTSSYFFLLSPLISS